MRSSLTHCRRIATWALALCLPLCVGAAELPAVHFEVELRWVHDRLAPAAQAALRDGAVVVGTTGSVSAQGPAVPTLSTAPSAQRVEALASVRVLNGHTGSMQISLPGPPQQPMQLDMAVALNAERRVERVLVQPQPAVAAPRVLSLRAEPRWRGQRSDIDLALDLSLPDGLRLQTQLRLPEGRWRQVAQLNDPERAPAPTGTVSSRDAEARESRQLQVRVQRVSP